MIAVGLLVVATVLLVAGAELFVENAAAAGKRLGVTALAVGLLLAGAEPEELLTAVLAALQDRPGLAVGDAIGANVTMLTVTLGLAALLRPVPVGPRVRRYAWLSAAAGAVAALVLWDGRVGRPEGAVLLLAYVGLVGLVWWRERTPPMLGELAEIGDLDEVPDQRRGRALALVLVGLAVMTAGGAAAVEGATRLVVAVDRSDSAIGLTVLALATTAELFALVLTAARHDVAELAVAGIVGSAAYNATMTLGGAALARPLVTDIGPAAVVAAGLPVLLLVLAKDGRLGRMAGLLLVTGYVGYVITVLV